MARRLIPLLVLALAGCGGGATTRRSTIAEGRDVFLSQCSRCHALAGQGTRAPAGGDLGGYRMSVAEVATFAKIMPTRTALSPRQLDAVSRYIWSIQQRRGSTGYPWR